MHWIKSMLLSVGFHIINLLCFGLFFTLFVTLLAKFNLDSIYTNLGVFFVCIFISYHFYSWYKLKRVAFDSDILVASKTRKWNYYILIAFVVLVIALIAIARIGGEMRHQTKKFIQKQQTTHQFSGTKAQRDAQKAAQQKAVKTAEDRIERQKQIEAKEKADAPN